MAEALGAAETARAVARGETSARAEVEAAIARIEERDEAINAVVIRDFDRARIAADEADKRREPLPLRGVPMTIKESFDIAGLPTSWGFEQYRDHIAQADSVVARRLKAAGAIILGKTNVPVGLADWQSVNPIHGRTRNPIDPALSPGGSSGGAAAALASGMVPLEYGSDIGGSIRVPAHFCGVWGHKSSFGLVPIDGHYFPGTDGAGAEMGVAGPMARSAEDLALALTLTADVPPPPPRLASLEDARILVLTEHPVACVDAAIVGAIEAAADACARKGARIAHAATLPDLEAMHRDYMRLLGVALSRGAAQPGKAPPTLSHWFDLLDSQARFQRQWRHVFESFDAVFAPVMGAAAFPHDDAEMRERRLIIDGEPSEFGPQFAWSGLAAFTRLPATAVPIGAMADGRPIAMQVIVDDRQDLTAIAVAGFAAEAMSEAGA